MVSGTLAPLYIASKPSRQASEPASQALRFGWLVHIREKVVSIMEVWSQFQLETISISIKNHFQTRLK